MLRVAACLAVLAVVAVPTGVQADAVLVFETEDWRFEAPDVLGTQADLELSGRQIQLCTDEVERLISHRPRNVARFTWRWSIGGGPVSFASPVGVESRVPNESYRLIDPVSRPFRESIVARGACFGPHEVTHVLTWESWRLLWANEGFATFTDWLYEGASWRYGQPTQLRHDCDETGFTDGGERRPYSDLRRFAVTHEMYATAACFWLEVHRRGGFPALRRILMRTRAIRATTAGELVVHHVNSVLGIDFRQIAKRYGFTDDDLTADGAPPPDPPPPSLLLSRMKVPAPARAGRPLTVSVAVARSDTGDPPSGATVSCTARIGGAALRASAKRFAAGRASCSWRLPLSARGRTLRLTIAVAELGVAARAGYSTRVR